jgi:hypothetical protein
VLPFFAACILGAEKKACVDWEDEFWSTASTDDLCSNRQVMLTPSSVLKADASCLPVIIQPKLALSSYLGQLLLNLHLLAHLRARYGLQRLPGGGCHVWIWDCVLFNRLFGVEI